MTRSIGFLDKSSQGNLTQPDQPPAYAQEVDIKEWVLAARKHGRLTQEALGTILNVSKANVSAWENGHHEPSFGQMVRISLATNCPMPTAGYKPRKAFSPYATALAEYIDRQAEEDRKTCAIVAREAIDQHVKDAKKGRTAKTANPQRQKPTPKHQKA